MPKLCCLGSKEMPRFYREKPPGETKWFPYELSVDDFCHNKNHLAYFTGTADSLITMLETHFYDPWLAVSAIINERTIADLLMASPPPPVPDWKEFSWWCRTPPIFYLSRFRWSRMIMMYIAVVTERSII